MHTNRDCIDLIERVLDAAGDPASAYLLRTRLQRSILSATRLAASQVGIEVPELPDVDVVAEQVTGEAAEVLASCSRLRGITEHICQPSEALDTRWREGWSEVKVELKCLCEVLERLKPRASH